jgi:ABC-type multidrug transport system fused ATPase/permease subunit
MRSAYSVQEVFAQSNARNLAARADRQTAAIKVSFFVRFVKIIIIVVVVIIVVVIFIITIIMMMMIIIIIISVCPDAGWESGPSQYINKTINVITSISRHL